MKVVIDIPQGLKIDFENENWTALTCAEMKNALMHGTILPKGHGRLIDGDKLESRMKIGYCIVREAPTIIEADKEGSGDT